MQPVSILNNRHGITAEHYRTNVLSRRIKAPEAVATLLTELAYGPNLRDSALMLPSRLADRNRSEVQA